MLEIPLLPKVDGLDRYYQGMVQLTEELAGLGLSTEEEDRLSSGCSLPTFKTVCGVIRDGK